MAAVAVASALSYLLLTGPRDEVLARWSGRSREETGPDGSTKRGRASDEDVEDGRA